MAESLIGNLAVLLTMETAAFEKGTSHASKLLRKTQRDFEGMATKVAGVGSKMSLAITAPLVGFGAVALREANEANAAMAQVNSALTSMGPVAGRTAEQLKAASNALEMSSLYEGDEILRKVTANLLTFGNISGQAFDRAQQAALNLSTRMGTDLQSSALMVGKALNDPIKGMTALGRAGVQFSEGQRATIKALVETGQTAQAQSIILGELERQFGGAALAAQNADPYNKATDAFKQMAETVGNALLPIIPPLTNAIVSVANAFAGLSPGVQKFIIIAGGVAVVIGPILVALGGLISLTGTLLPLIIKLGPAFLALKTAFIAARVAALATLPALIPFIVPLGAIAVAVGAVYLAFKNWDKITAIAKRMVDGVKAVLGTLSAPFNAVKAGIQSVADKFKWLDNVVVRNSYIPDMVLSVGEWMTKLVPLMVKPAEDAAAATSAAFAGIQSPNVSVENGGGFSPLSPNAQAAFDKAQATAGIIRDIAKDLAQMTGSWLSDLVSGTATLKDLWKSVLSYALQALTSSSGPLGALFGGARANGGPVLGGSAYLVGERGPELFMPGQSGRIISNDNSRAMMGRGNTYINVNTPDANSFNRSAGQIRRDWRRRVA